MDTMIKHTNPASPKTNPERGLFSRKDFPLDWELPPGGGAETGSVCVTVTGPSDPVVESGRVAVGGTEGTDRLLGVENSVPGGRRGRTRCGRCWRCSACREGWANYTCHTTGYTGG